MQTDIPQVPGLMGMILRLAGGAAANEIRSATNPLAAKSRGERFKTLTLAGFRAQGAPPHRGLPLLVSCRHPGAGGAVTGRSSARHLCRAISPDIRGDDPRGGQPVDGTRCFPSGINWGSPRRGESRVIVKPLIRLSVNYSKNEFALP